MIDYDFHELDDGAFECFVRDLLQMKYKVPFENFPKGKDAGIDLKYEKDDQLWIVQCKHYRKSRFNKLKTDLTKELDKIAKHNPSKYIVATSFPLTKGNKDDISKIFSNICSETLVFGKDDLNNLLGKHTSILNNYPQLWISNTFYLDKIIHSGIYAKTDNLLEEIEREIKKYVENNSWNRTTELLENHHYCIISGIPGIGKTFLAKRLTLSYVSQGFTPVCISSDINEAYKVLGKDKNKKLFFYYDDFLGSTMYREFVTKQDKDITEFIKICQKNKNLRFVATTREYILNQAINICDSFENDLESLNKCIIKLDDYTKLDKAQILFNHIFYSEIGDSYKLELLKNKRYKKIISHKNFNPRIIEQMTKKGPTEPIQCIDYFESFMDSLSNPIKVWEKAFKNHIHPESKYFLLALYMVGNNIDIDSILQALSAFLDNIDYKKPIEQKSIIKELDNCFIKTSIDVFKGNGNIIFNLFDPSLKDYIENYLIEEKDVLKKLIESSQTFEQVYNLWELINNKLADDIPKLLILPLAKKFEEYYSIYGENYYLNESRLLFIIRFVSISNHKMTSLKIDPIEYLTTFIDQFINRVKKNKFDTECSYDLIKFILDNIQMHIPRKDELVDLLKYNILNNYSDSIEYFETVSNFITSYKTIVSEEEINHFKSYALKSINDMDFPDDDLLEYLLDIVKKIESQLEIDLSLAKDKIVENIDFRNEERRANKEYEYDDFYEDGKTFNYSRESLNKIIQKWDIDSKFDDLKREIENKQSLGNSIDK
ncbi:MAG: restriction endonuclease [Caldisericales bacterium]|nr:restriction endonuclease [Caldisericales bacterium]